MPTLPLINARNRVIAKKARTTDTSTSSTTFEIALDGGKRVDVLAIAGHNMTSSASIRIRMYDDSAKTQLAYDSTLINVWPSVYGETELEWELTNYWEGTVSDNEIASYTPLFYHIVSSEQMLYPAKIVVEITDIDNPAGYVEFGRVFIGTGFQPTLNMEYGAQLGYSISTTVESSLNDTDYFDVRRPKRIASISLDALTAEEAHSTMMNLIRSQGIDKEIFFCYHCTENSLQYNRTFLSRIQQPDPIQQPYVDRFATTLNLVEIL